MDRTRTHRVLVVGGGYAGIAAARAAARGGATVTIVDAGGRHELLPRLAAVAGGSAPAGDAWAPLEDLTGLPVVPGRVASLDVARREAVLVDGRRLAYDAAVVTVGAASAPPGIPGLGEHGRRLVDARSALALRAELDEVASLVVVGGGATGVQLAGEVAACRPQVAVTLVEAADGLLPSFRAGLGDRAAAVLRERGVAVRTGVGLARVTPAGAELADGTTVPGLVVWAGGAAPRAAALLPAAPAQRGRLLVDAAQQVPGADRVLAAGDAAVQRGPDGAVLPLSGQVAEQSGARAGRNAARLVRGRAARPGFAAHRGWVVPLGAGTGVAHLLGLVLVGRLLGGLVPLLHLLVDWRHLLRAGGLRALRRYAPGRHRPDAAAVRAVREGRGTGPQLVAPRPPLARSA